MIGRGGGEDTSTHKHKKMHRYKHTKYIHKRRTVRLGGEGNIQTREEEEEAYKHTQTHQHEHTHYIHST